MLVKLQDSDDSSSSKAPSLVKDEPVAPTAWKPLGEDERKMRRQLAELVLSSKRAYALLYEAIPEDIRPQVAHLHFGYAHALWVWLEKKYQSTEDDTVHELTKKWIECHQNEGESFDSYRAKVNEVHRLLEVAKDKPSGRQYMFTLLYKLQPQYSAVVLAIRASGMLKDADKVNWDEVTAMVNAHERAEQRLEDDHSSGKTMSVTSSSNNEWITKQRNKNNNNKTYSNIVKKNSDSKSNDVRGSGPPRNMSEVQCFRCEKYGHMKNECPNPKASKKGGNGGGASKPRYDRSRSPSPAPLALKSALAKDHANSVRHAKPSEALSGSDVSEPQVVSQHRQQAFGLRLVNAPAAALPKKITPTQKVKSGAQQSTVAVVKPAGGAVKVSTPASPVVNESRAASQPAAVPAAATDRDPDDWIVDQGETSSKSFRSLPTVSAPAATLRDAVEQGLCCSRSGAPQKLGAGHHGNLSRQWNSVFVHLIATMQSTDVRRGSQWSMVDLPLQGLRAAPDLQ